MDWFRNRVHRDVAISAIQKDSQARAENVAAIFASLSRMTKVASGNSDLHFYVDPRLAADFNINLHLIDSHDSARENEKRAAKSSDATAFDGFKEETISFPSLQKRDPNYLCSIVSQRQDGIITVSAYLMETYLGKYAYRTNLYFREKSSKFALRCFDRILEKVKDLKKEVIEGAKHQNEIPYLLRRALQDEKGEVEHKTDSQVAVYLDPENVPPKRAIGSENILTIPEKRSIKDDLVLPPEQE